MKTHTLNKTTLCLLSLLASQQGVAAELLYPANATMINNSAEAKQYLLDYFQVQPTSVVTDLTARYQRESLNGTHYNFDVIDDQGKNCHKTLVLSVDKTQKVQRIYAQLEALSGSCDGTIEKPRTNFDITQPTIPAATKTVNVTTQVYNPDPRTMNQEPVPTDGNFANYTLPSNYQQVTMPVLCSTAADAKCVLANDKLVAIDIVNLPDGETGKKAQQLQQGHLSFAADGIANIDITKLDPAKAADNTFVHNYFYDVMAFYHLDSSLRYVEQLGFDQLFYKKVQFDAQASSDNNSKFLIDMNLLSFGLGGSPDTLDADVVLHEFGHTMNYFILPDWAYGDTGGIGEGFGDYWAGMSSFRTQYQQGSEFELDEVFNFDGHFGGNGGTRRLDDHQARYYPSADYQAHISVNGSLSDQLWSTPLFQSLKDAVAIYHGDAFDAMNRIIIEGLYGLGRGVKMHHTAQSILDAAQALYPNQEYGAILRSHFTQHNLLPTKLILTAAPQFIDSNTSKNKGQISAVIYNPTQLPISLTGQLTATGQASTLKLATADKPLTLKAKQHHKLAYPLAKQPQCGQTLDLTLDASLRFDNQQRVQDLNFTQKFIYGLPQFAQMAKVFNQSLIDAQKGNNPFMPMRKGVTYATFFSNSDQATVGDDFAVITHLTHPDHRELKVILIAPDGQQITLHDHQAHYQSDKYTVYRLADHPQLRELLGTRMSGAWRLEVTDIAIGNRGQLVSFGVTHIKDYECKDTNVTPILTPQPKPDNNSGGGGSALWLALLALVQLGYSKMSLFTRRSIKR
ncbi:proprotein convertase P-domain-containing protein [Photobacterium swingsii]|uniref:proprotein convertase P-domain-containing protein n=1 Tax=Photobacterium swingsii TaxID=680026 RepID=UPI00406900D5